MPGPAGALLAVSRQTAHAVRWCPGLARVPSLQRDARRCSARIYPVSIPDDGGTPSCYDCEVTRSAAAWRAALRCSCAIPACRSTCRPPWCRRSRARRAGSRWSRWTWWWWAPRSPASRLRPRRGGMSSRSWSRATNQAHRRPGSRRWAASRRRAPASATRRSCWSTATVGWFSWTRPQWTSRPTRPTASGSRRAGASTLTLSTCPRGRSTGASATCWPPRARCPGWTPPWRPAPTGSTCRRAAWPRRAPRRRRGWRPPAPPPASR